jgi:hypothetical protein
MVNTDPNSKPVKLQNHKAKRIRPGRQRQKGTRTGWKAKVLVPKISFLLGRSHTADKSAFNRTKSRAPPLETIQLSRQPPKI